MGNQLAKFRFLSLQSLKPASWVRGLDTNPAQFILPLIRQLENQKLHVGRFCDDVITVLAINPPKTFYENKSKLCETPFSGSFTSLSAGWGIVLTE